MSKDKSTRVPTPLYAAAGVGDLAYEKIRNLPDRVTKLRDRVVELSPTVKDRVSEHDLRADLRRLRVVARRNAAALLDGAQTAQEKAAVLYADLVARGELVVRAARADKTDQTAADEPTAELTGDAPTAALPAEESAGEPAGKAAEEPVKPAEA